MRFKIHHHTFYTADFDGNEVELPIGPAEEHLHHDHKVIGNKLVIGYLVHDDDCQNPFESRDAQGTLYTACRGRVITDDEGAVLRALGLTSLSSGSRYPKERDLDCDGVWELAISKLRLHVAAMDHDDEPWFDDMVREWLGEERDEEWIPTSTDRSKLLNRIDFGPRGDVLPSELETLWQQMQEEAWDQLYDQGKIGEYLAVPVSYCDSNHGPGTTSADTCDIDDANAVWVPDDCAIQNIEASAASSNIFDLKRAAVKYADAVLEEYVKWCNGGCFGYVVATYTNVGTEEEPVWEQVDDYDSCWGFIGDDWAEEELTRVFNYHVEKVSNDQPE